MNSFYEKDITETHFCLIPASLSEKENISITFYGLVDDSDPKNTIKDKIKLRTIENNWDSNAFAWFRAKVVISYSGVEGSYSIGKQTTGNIENYLESKISEDLVSLAYQDLMENIQRSQAA